MDIQSINAVADIITQLFQSMLPPLSAYIISKSFSIHVDDALKPVSIDDVNSPAAQKQKYTSINYRRIESTEIRDMIFDFSITLGRLFPEEALINFYNNVNEVNIEKNYLILLFSASGMYSGIKNRIRYATTTSIYHELFHMASSVYDSENKVFYSGFKQVYGITNNLLGDSSIGQGINEGYTELLAHRYFDKDNKMPWSYQFETRIVSYLEEIVDSSELEILYLTADLQGLIEKLTEYTNENEVLGFIKSVDFINNYSEEIPFLYNPALGKSIERIYNFLLKAYMVKQKEQYEKGVISRQEAESNVANYCLRLGNCVGIGSRTYYYLDRESVNTIYEQVIATPSKQTKMLEQDVKVLKKSS